MDTQLSLKFDNFSGTDTEFLIVISPPKEVMEYANGLKKEFYQSYGNYDGRHSTPHITITNFQLTSDREEKIFSAFQRSISGLEPFLLFLNGFGNFKGSNVIYIHVEDWDGLELLQQKVLELKKELNIGKRFFLLDKPHLTIAKKLSKNIFEQAKSDYLSKSYTALFFVDTLKVLRYDTNIRRYFVYGDLKLGG